MSLVRHLRSKDAGAETAKPIRACSKAKSSFNANTYNYPGCLTQNYLTYHMSQSLIVDKPSENVTGKRYSINAAIEFFPAIVLVT